MAKLTKISRRIRRGAKTSIRIKQQGRERGTIRMVIGRSNTHIYGQIIHPEGGKVMASASSLELRGESGLTKTEQAKKVGALLAQRSKEKGIEKVACDRSGFVYHGRLAALVDAAREAGLEV